MVHLGTEQSQSGFCDPSPAGLFRQMMEGCSLWSTPRPTSHSPHALRPRWQHARAWHFGRGIYSEKSNPCPQPAPWICHHAGWLKITLRHAWVDLVDKLHYSSRANHVSLEHWEMHRAAINTINVRNWRHQVINCPISCILEKRLHSNNQCIHKNLQCIVYL